MGATGRKLMREPCLGLGGNGFPKGLDEGQKAVCRFDRPFDVRPMPRAGEEEQSG